MIKESKRRRLQTGVFYFFLYDRFSQVQQHRRRQAQQACLTGSAAEPVSSSDLPQRFSSTSASRIMAMPVSCFFVGRSLKRIVLTSMTAMMVPVLKMGYTRNDGSLVRVLKGMNEHN